MAAFDFANPPSTAPVAAPPTVSAADLDFSALMPNAPGATPAPSVRSPAPATSPTVAPTLSAADLDFSGLVPPPPSSVADAARSFGVGLLKGAAGLAAAPVTLPKAAADAAVSGGDWLVRKALNLGAPSQATLDAQAKAAASAPNIGIDRPVGAALDGLNGALPTPQTTVGKYAQAVGEFVPGAAVMPGNLAVNALRYAAVPAVASEGLGQLASGTAAEPYARLAGAVAGGAIGSGLTRAVTPFPIDASRQAMVDTLAGEGVPLTAGQVTGNRPLRWMESILSDTPGAGGKAEAIAEAQRGAYTAAALRRIGANSEQATPEVLAAAKAGIGKQFDDLSARNTATFDPQFGRDLGGVLNDYDNLSLPRQQAPVVGKTIQGLASLGGTMPGPQYQAVRSNLDKSARAIAQSDPPLSGALFGIRNALDGAMDRSITPEDQGAWQDARAKWKNWKVIEKASTGAGEDAAQGSISPAALRSATVAQNRGAYATGQGDFSDLARAGQGLMTPLPNSGTAPRQFVQHLMQAGGSGLGAFLHGTEGALVGAEASTIGVPLLGRLLMSSPVQGYLKNQALPPPLAGGILSRIIQANQARQGGQPPQGPMEQR